MNRSDIMDECPEGFEDKLKEFIDYCEGAFNEIKDKLTINDVSNLHQVEDAYDIALTTAVNLY